MASGSAPGVLWVVAAQGVGALVEGTVKEGPNDRTCLRGRPARGTILVP